MLWLLYFEGSVTTSCGSLLYSCLCTCLPPHERVPSVFDKCFQADVDSRIKEEMKGKAEELDVTTFQGQVWKWMIRRRRRTGEEDCGRLALACASLVRDYEASGGHKLTSALKTIWLRAACFLSIVLFFSSYLFFMDCCMNTLFLICNKPQYLGLIYSMADLSVKAPSLVVETLNGYFVLLSIHAYMFQTFDVMIWNTHQLLQVLRRNQTQKLKVKLQTILFLLTHDREWCIASSSTWFIKKSQRGTGKKEKPF